MRYELLGIASASAGLLSHLLYFIHGHKATQAPQILVFYLIAECFLYARSIHLLGALQGYLTASVISLCYFLALFTSIVIYRVFFHRLRHFPGPFWAKVTKFYSPWIAWDGKLHEKHAEFFEKYGDVVRIAPNELIFLSIDTQQKLHAATTRCSKRESVYEVLHYEGHLSLETLLSRDEHRRRRQIWDKAFNTKALESYEAYAREVVYEWLEKMATLQGQPVNTSLYSLLIPFENMGRMGFSHNFGSIQKGVEDPMLHYLEVTLGSVGKLGAMYWPIALLNAVGGSSDHVAFQRLSCGMVDKREQVANEEQEDIMKYLLQDYRAKEPKAFRHHNMLYSDSQALMVGGTDTIGAVLSFIFYYTARDPAIQKRLHDELEPLYGRTMSGEFTNRDLSEAEAPYLNAIINETMRMNNPTCSNGPRVTPPEGLEIDGVFIPGKVAVYSPIHANHRSAKFFKEPDTFIPERWTTRPDLVIDKRAYHPFLLGPHSCVGKRIALIVIRLVVAYTVWYYEYEFAPGEDGVAILRDSVNGQILKAGKLECVFRQRT
ncbi:cytochrome P450 [Trichoderma citrinoviride]|uniref:Cytochrome P450 n=1 Tax=Trichoderma citrinoviride TaxID=58853 RepID=A0A2T4B152_9HYPO|nr:cytochrome P450 [Trichoderma citrinoviride]PTB63052.1 cytochrome P450 [Trichoderma citrinoviride]